MTEHPSFGEWLRKQRRALDLSRQQLADQAGCAEITLRRIEGGTLKPSKELAAILLEKVGIPQDNLDQWVRFARGQAELPVAETSSKPNQPKTNLPAQLTSFIGREKELADVSSLLEKHRLVTLIGSGGVGKTRLSHKVGEGQSTHFSDGTWLMELAPLDNPQLIPQTLAVTLGVPASAVQPVNETLLNFLRTKNTLLIFDNCEHLLDACAQLADMLLKHCPNLKILATSREALGIMGEAMYLVPTLALPDTDKLLHAFRDVGSMRLFEERAQLVQMDFSLTMENASFIAQICLRLDGIPLALELAAVQVNQLSVKEIASQLNDTFHILAGGSRTALPRQQTIRASIDWSWNLLTNDERALLRRLSVFAGGWTFDAAQAVCGGDALTLINLLVRKSLVVVSQASGGEKRYHFHEVIRQYAREKLVEAGEDESIHQHHANYFISLAEKADAKFHGAEEMLWLVCLDAELANLRAALEFTLEHDKDNAVRLSGALGWFWYRRGLLAEGRGWYEKILAGREPDMFSAENLIKAFYGAGLIAHYQGDYAHARTMLTQSLTLAQKQEDPSGIAHAIILLGSGYVWQGDFATTDKYALESIDLFRASGEVWGQAFALNVLGFSALMRGDFAKAYSCFEESVKLARNAGDKYIMSMPLSNFGIMAYQQGDLERGKELLEESLDIGLEVQDPTVITWSMASLGHIARHQGDFARATELYETVLEDCRITGFMTGTSEMLHALGVVAVKTGEYQKARSLLQEGLGLFQSQGDVRSVVFCLNSFAALAGATSNWRLAVKLLGFVDSQMRGMGMSMAPIDKEAFDQVVHDARHAMRDSEFKGLWVEGEKLSMPEAVALVLNTGE